MSRRFITRPFQSSYATRRGSPSEEDQHEDPIVPATNISDETVEDPST